MYNYYAMLKSHITHPHYLARARYINFKFLFSLIEQEHAVELLRLLKLFFSVHRMSRDVLPVFFFLMNLFAIFVALRIT